jgi:hypothetical protein
LLQYKNRMIAKERGFAEAPARASLREKNEKPKASTIASGNFISHAGALSAPLNFYSPKKEGGKFLVYFRFLMIQKPTITARATITAATMMASSVVMNGASDGSVGSGSIGPPADGAGSTVMYVDADDL